MLWPGWFLLFLLCVSFVVAHPMMERVARAAGDDASKKAISETASEIPTPTLAAMPSTSASPVAGSEPDDSDDDDSNKGLTKGEGVLLSMASVILALISMPALYAYITYDPSTDIEDEEEMPCCGRVWASKMFSVWHVLLLRFTLMVCHQRLIMPFCFLLGLVSFVLVAEGIVEGQGELMAAALFLCFLISGFLANEEMVHPDCVTRVGVCLFLFYYALMFTCLVIIIPAMYIATADDNTAVVLSMLVALWLCGQVVKNLCEGLIRHQGKWGNEDVRARWSRGSDGEDFIGGSGTTRAYQTPGGAGDYNQAL